MQAMLDNVAQFWRRDLLLVESAQKNTAKNINNLSQSDIGKL